jgi:hypothetical protein
MNNDQIATIAEMVLRPRLGPLGFERVEVSAGHDHDGDPALFIAAHYQEGSEVPKGDVLLDALGALHEALREAGENRLPYLDHRFFHDAHDHEEEVEDEEQDSSGPRL